MHKLSLNFRLNELRTLLTLNNEHEQNKEGLPGMVLHPDFSNFLCIFVVYN